MDYSERPSPAESNDTILEAGNTIILVTHEEDVAAYAHRIVRFRDGVVESDEIKPRVIAAIAGEV